MESRENSRFSEEILVGKSREVSGNSKNVHKHFILPRACSTARGRSVSRTFPPRIADFEQKSQVEFGVLTTIPSPTVVYCNVRIDWIKIIEQ